MKFSSKLIAAAAVAAASTGAMASGLDGDAFTFQYFFPSLSSPYDAPESFVAGPSNDFSLIGYGTVDVSAHQVTVDFTYSATWSPTSFNGFVLSDFPANSITSVTVDGATTDRNFSSSFVSFTNDSINVNWQGMPFGNGQTVVLDVGTAAAVPEASNLAMMGAGLALFAGVARRRRVR